MTCDRGGRSSCSSKIVLNGGELGGLINIRTDPTDQRHNRGLQPHTRTASPRDGGRGGTSIGIEQQARGGSHPGGKRSTRKGPALEGLRTQ